MPLAILSSSVCWLGSRSRNNCSNSASSCTNDTARDTAEPSPVRFPRVLRHSFESTWACWVLPTGISACSNASLIAAQCPRSPIAEMNRQCWWLFAEGELHVIDSRSIRCYSSVACDDIWSRIRLAGTIFDSLAPDTSFTTPMCMPITVSSPSGWLFRKAGPPLVP